MFLRSLTLRGFKSFAGKTVLEFTPGVSVIVGPNGSGKSNLVDAISWVLGEQGPRALRGGQMADVIFAGSPARSALGMAEVKLVIDNTAEQIPVPLSELEISRTIFRSGDSEYRIGGQPCRLLDIQELLQESGIGRALHTVVGQGQLEDVLTARPEERRQYIEEAAGIAKHRRRKERAQRKLASLEQDLLRLQDVLTELRRQLRPLRQQAEVAGRHEQLTAEADALAARLEAARLRRLYRDRDARLGGWEEGQELRSAARSRLEELDRDIEGLAGERDHALRVLEEAEAAHREAEGRRAASDESVRRAAATESDIRARLARAAEHTARAAALEHELARVEATHAETSSGLAEREPELETAEAEHRAREQRRLEVEQERRRASEEAVAHRAEVEALTRSLSAYEGERARIEAGLASVTERLRAAAVEREGLESEIERLDGEETHLSERQAAVARGRQELDAEVGGLEERRRELAARSDLLQARRRDIEDTPGTRFLRSHRGRAIGLLGELVRTEGKARRALAAALGPFADAVVYEDREAALADAPQGDGATLASAAGEGPAPRLPGVQSLLSLITPDRRVKGLVATLLGNVYVTSSLEEATALHAVHPRASFVTLEGVLVGPSMIRTAAETDSRLKEVRRDLAEVDHDLAAIEAELDPKRSRLEEVTAELQEVSSELNRHDSLITAAAERMGRLGADLSALEKEEALLVERLAGIDDAASAWRASLEGATPVHLDLPEAPPLSEPPVSLRVEVETLRRERSRFEATMARIRTDREELAANDPEALAGELEAALAARSLAEEALAAALEEIRAASIRREEAAEAERDTARREADVNRAWREAAAELERLRDDYEQDDRVRAELDRRIDLAERVLREGHGLDPAAAVAELSDEDLPETVERRAELVSRRLALLGRVNSLAQGELHSLEERHDFLKREIDDVKTARRDLLEIVNQVDYQIATLFEVAYRDVAAEFERLFGELFPGGEGKVVMTEPSEPLTSGIELEARPGRKRVKRISLLSGGERALTALAFLFAIFRSRPSPFYLLDEVEAALDDVNLHRFLGLIKGFAATSQVLLVTHQKRTMEIADVLYGVSMGREGSSTVVCQKLDRGDDGEKAVVIGVPEADPVH